MKRIDGGRGCGRGCVAFGLIFGMADSMEVICTDLDTEEGCETWEAKTEGDLKQGTWVDKIAYDSEGAELIRVKNDK